MSEYLRSYFIHPTLSAQSQRELTVDETNYLTKIFYACDERNKGFLSKEDVKIAFVSIFGYKPSKLEVDPLFHDATTSPGQSKGLLLKKFIAAISTKYKTRDEDEEIRQTFLAFDRQCRGFLTIDDLKKGFTEVAPNMPQHAIEAAFREVDRDSDGRVSYRDFEFMMKYNENEGL